MPEGALNKIWESSGEGLVLFSSPPAGLLLGNGGNAVKRALVKIPLGKRLRLHKGFLSLTVLAAPPVKPPIKWRVELDGATVSRELKPQLSARLDDVDVYRAVFDVSPILEGRQDFAERHLKISYDSAHPITLAEASLLSLSPIRIRHAAVYHYGLISLEPGEELWIPTMLPASFGGETVIYTTIFSRSPRASIKIKAGEVSQEASGHGLKTVELVVPSHVEKVLISYPATEIKVFPKRAAIFALVAMSREPVAPLELAVERVERRGGEVVLELVLSNRGEEPVEQVEVAARQGGVSLKELRLSGVLPGASERISLRLDVSRLQRGGRLSVHARWAKQGVSSCRTVEVEV